MGLEQFKSGALEDLCSTRQTDLLDSIDSLRSQGISHYVSLPQIIVCGDQSSGKSSVLEAISGISFPVKSNLCTRFPTELILRKTSKSSVKVKIVPHHSNTEGEQQRLSKFNVELNGFDGFHDLIEDAKSAMGLSTHGKAFSRDLLRIEISGPDRPHVTMVDLPGLIHSETRQQSASDVQLVQEVVQQYMKEPRSIILAVVSAKNDYANQVVLKLARTADKRGSRTLGVITKPDQLKPGSESEAMFASLAKNQDVEFRLGWHVLRNMDSEDGTSSMRARDEAENIFFSTGIWTELSPQLLGISTLRQRLSDVLLSQIASELPSLITEIETNSDGCRARLAKMGEPRATLAEQRLYLFQLSQQYHSLVKAAVDGTYNEDFFEDATTDKGYKKRVRAVIQNLNLDFAKRMARYGHYREITEVTRRREETTITPIHITRAEYLEHVQFLMERTRGRELPGTFNPLIVADLFRQQSSPWKVLTQEHVDSSWNAAKDFLGYLLAYIPDENTSKSLLQQVFEPAMKQLLDGLNVKMQELLAPHQKSHPITYNHYLTETIQKARNEQLKEQYSKTLETFFGVATINTPLDLSESPPQDLRLLVAALMNKTEPDMNKFACSEALACMESYYKVAMKRFIDDVAIEVIETKLVSALGDIFSPVTVSTMSPELVTLVAGESEASRGLRQQLVKQLDVLSKGSEICRHFVGLGFYDPEDKIAVEAAWETKFELGDKMPSEIGLTPSPSSKSLALQSASPSPEEEPARESSPTIVRIAEASHWSDAPIPEEAIEVVAAADDYYEPAPAPAVEEEIRASSPVAEAEEDDYDYWGRTRSTGLMKKGKNQGRKSSSVPYNEISDL